MKVLTKIKEELFHFEKNIEKNDNLLNNLFIN